MLCVFYTVLVLYCGVVVVVCVLRFGVFDCVECPLFCSLQHTSEDIVEWIYCQFVHVELVAVERRLKEKKKG